VVDLSASTVGRGLWVHARAVCLAEAARRGLARALRSRVDVTLEGLAAAIATAADRRIAGLLAAAQGGGHAAIGGDALAAAGDGCHLVLVAHDAKAGARLDAVAAAHGRGAALVWGDKHALGTPLGRSEVAVVGITARGIATALAHALALAALASSVHPEKNSKKDHE
jgi:hypothetical protein